MADAEDTPSTTAAATHRRTSNGSRRQAHREDDLETQIAELQSDIKAISSTLQRMGQTTVTEVKSQARHRAQDLADRGQSMLDSAQGELSGLEKQLKDTIRDKPLTAVAAAIGMGFLIAIMTR
jgi:ElaB/YqjD/DUF883 family membrane-anchored ribosome-binding protein